MIWRKASNGIIELLWWHIQRRTIINIRWADPFHIKRAFETVNIHTSCDDGMMMKLLYITGLSISLLHHTMLVTSPHHTQPLLVSQKTICLNIFNAQYIHSLFCAYLSSGKLIEIEGKNNLCYIHQLGLG